MDDTGTSPQPSPIGWGGARRAGEDMGQFIPRPTATRRGVSTPG
jgi:hypothetical protein